MEEQQWKGAVQEKLENVERMLESLTRTLDMERKERECQSRQIAALETRSEIYERMTIKLFILIVGGLFLNLVAIVVASYIGK